MLLTTPSTSYPTRPQQLFQSQLCSSNKVDNKLFHVHTKSKRIGWWPKREKHWKVSLEVPGSSASCYGMMFYSPFKMH